MTDQTHMNSPLSIGDKVKVAIFLAITPIFAICDELFIPYDDILIELLVFCITLLALIGIYRMKRDKSFAHILYSKKMLAIFLALQALVVVVMSTIGFYTGKFVLDDLVSPSMNMEIAIYATSGFALVTIAVMVLMWIFNFLYFIPLEKHQNWVVENGIFSKGY